ncbi:unnamed protein product [Leuciscus chuanchicus]
MELKQTHKYYKQVVLPELVARQYTQPPPPVPSAELPVPSADSQPTDNPPPKKAQNTVRETLATLQPGKTPKHKVVPPAPTSTPPSADLPVPPAELPVPLFDSQPTDKNKKRARKNTIKTPLATLQPVNTPQPKRRACEKAVLWCRQPEELDNMVACDNQNCPIQWFHLGCVGLSSAPAREEAWQCDACTCL